ncbi:MAG: TRL-like family protein [Chitinispirillaceae bacterium]|nr:TRL-like family protein [Chitinispirillaceae bacterium]
MKKKIRAPIMMLMISFFLIGCGTTIPPARLASVISPVNGLYYIETNAPLTATENNTYSKVGSAMCSSFFGLVAIGDATIETASKKAGITKIHHIDYRSFNIFGIYASYTIYVYGE